MKKLLHVVASPRGEHSRTLKLSSVLINKIRKNYSGIEVDTLDLFGENLPEMNVTRVGGKYTLMSGKELEGEAAGSWEKIREHIDRFLSADAVVISTPMWNFNVPYKLKHYIDIIVQPGFTFKYGANGPEGLAGGKKIYVVSTRGGDYSKGSPAESFDKLEPYLKQVLGFIGLSDAVFISAQPMDATDDDGRKKNLEAAYAELEALKI